MRSEMGSRPAIAPLDGVSTYAGRAVEMLRTMILDGTLRSGERLNEVHLAQSLGISRGPLREAIQRLASEGLVGVISHRGAFVRAFDSEELADLYEVRIALETHATRLVAKSASREDLTALAESLVDAFEVGNAYPPELDFHTHLVRLTKNEPLLQATIEVGQKIHLARSRSARGPARAEAALTEHREIVASLLDGDGNTAAFLLTEHLSKSLKNALMLLSSELEATRTELSAEDA